MASAQDIKAQLAKLNRQFNSIKGEIDRCTTIFQRMNLAKKRKPLLDKIEECEVALEKDRVSTAVREFEASNPPVTEECALCHERIKIGSWANPTLRSRGEPYHVLTCCAKIICNKCNDGREDSTDCLMCKGDLLKVGSEEIKLQLKEKAENGHVASQVQLGVCLLGSTRGPCDGFEVDKQEGLKWIKLAADQKHPVAMHLLGEYYHTGLNGLVKKSPTKSLSLLEQAAKLGAIQAHQLLGIIYMQQGNQTKSIKHFTLLYGLGNCEHASIKLGMSFTAGIGGLEKNLILAKHYLQEAAMQHVIEEAYAILGNTLIELNTMQYDGSIHIPGHSCIPKAAFWLRHAWEDNQDAEARNTYQRLEFVMQNCCQYCLKTAIGRPRAPGIEQCPNKLQRCNRCKISFYCNKQCQAGHWKRGHKIDCINPKDFSEKFENVEIANKAIRAAVPPGQYEESRERFAQDLMAAVRRVGPPPPI